MPTLRALRTLNAVECGTLDGAGLEARLAELGHLAEFYELLASRGQARRMASNALTMEAMSVSERAYKVIFQSSTNYNTTAAKAVADSPVAMHKIATSINALTVAINNTTSWNLFIASANYESNIKTIVSLFAGFASSNYETTSDIIKDPAATYAIAQNENAMFALVNSPITMAIVVQTTTAMQDIVASTSAFTIMANNTKSMNLVAQSSIAMATITDAARAIVVGIPSALKIFASYPILWSGLMQTSTTLDTTIYTIITTLTTVDSTAFTTTAQIFANSVAMGKVASDRASMVAIMNEPTTLNLMIASTQLDVVLGNSVSMGLFAGNVTIMNDLIGNTTAFPLLLNSTLAKTAIFTTPALVTTMTTANSTSLATITGLSTTKLGPVPDTKIGTFQSLDLPGNIIVLTAKLGSIVATQTDIYLKGTTQSVSTHPTPGTAAASVYPIINLPFTDILWDINSIAATAAARVTVTYVQF